MPGGVITTGAHPKALWPGVHAFWGQVYNSHPTEYPDLYDVMSSTQAYEEDVQITGFGLAPAKPEGDGLAYDSEQQGWVSRYTHIAYALGFKVTFEELNDDLYPVVARRRAQANAFSINQTIENIAAVLWSDAFTGSFFLHADGLSVINPAHLNVTGGTFSNELVPAAALSETSLEDMVIQVMDARTDRGLRFQLMCKSLHIGRTEWFNAHRILKSINQPGTANNDLNVLRATNAFPGGIKLNHYFTWTRQWAVRTNCPNGLNFFWRNQPMFDQDNDFDTKNAKAATYMRFSVGATDPRSLYGSDAP